MSRREFIVRGIYLAGAFGCLPSGLALADEPKLPDGMTMEHLRRIIEVLNENNVPGPHFVHSGQETHRLRSRNG